MDATLAYNLALFLHIGGVLALFAALTLEGAALAGLRRAMTADTARLWLGLLRPLRWLGPASLALILLAGLYLAANITAGGGWIGVGLLGFLVIAVVGGAVTGRRMAAVGPGLGRADGILGEAELKLASDGALAASWCLRVALALGIVLLMTVKPDALPSLFVLVVAGLIGLAGGRILNRPAAAIGRSAEGRPAGR
jgi:hypothetical protein